MMVSAHVVGILQKTVMRYNIHHFLDCLGTKYRMRMIEFLLCQRQVAHIRQASVGHADLADIMHLGSKEQDLRILFLEFGLSEMVQCIQIDAHVFLHSHAVLRDLVRTVGHQRNEHLNDRILQLDNIVNLVR